MNVCLISQKSLGFKNPLENALLEHSCSLFWSCVRGGTLEKPSSMYECMSNFTKKFGVQKHTGKRSPGAFLFTFSVLCEGGYFGVALKHVCMFESLKRLCMHVCLNSSIVYVCLKPISVYVCMFEALKRVCLKASSVYV